MYAITSIRIIARVGARVSAIARARYACLIAGFVVIAVEFFAVPQSSAYTFIHFGGRKGRPGVTDSLYMWNLGATGGNISWWFNRDELSFADALPAEFNAMHALIQPELNKWSSTLDVTFPEATSMAAANVVIEFESAFDGTGEAVPQQNNDGAAAQYNSFTGTTLNTAEIGLWPSDHWKDDAADFRFTILHEWGHILGLGDEYLEGSLTGEDFIDHGFPSGPAPNTNGKGDNVMNTNGVLTLDNDDIAAAEWLIGAGGNDALVTGKLDARAASDNAAAVASHHGPGTWQYRGTSSLAAGSISTVVTLDAWGVTEARSLGPGTWTSQIFPEKVIFTSAVGYAGNFIFELDSSNPEGYITAKIADSTPTFFTAIPLANGPQLFPNPMVFGPVPEPVTLLLILPAAAFGVLARRRSRAAR